METDTLPQLTPYFLSLFISFGIAIYAWRRRAIPGSVPFMVLVLGQAGWILGYIFELVSDSLDAKIFWDNFQFVGGAVWPPALLAFALQYTGHKLVAPRLIWGSIAVITTAIVIIPYTDDFHHLVRPDAALIPDTPFDVLTYRFTLALWLMYFYLVGQICYSVFLLTYGYTSSFPLFRRQVSLVIVGNLIPLVGITLTITGPMIGDQRDTSPITFAIGNLVVAWGLYRYQLLDLTPIAREQVFEHMSDMVLVVDTQDRLVNLNPAAQRNLDQPESQLIGKPLAMVFSNWVDLVEQYKNITETHTQLLIQQEGDQLYFDLKITPLVDRRGHLSGRVAIIRDITQYKKAELEIQRYTQELEATNQRLLALSQVKDNFVANVSHELRTPLSSLTLSQDLLRRSPGKIDEYLNRMQRDTVRLANIIEDLLRLSRLDQERAALDYQAIDLNDLTRVYVQDRVALAERKNITLAHVAESDLPQCSADEGFIGQVLSILLTNALNYTPEGGQITISTHQRVLDGQQWVGFSVRDTGPGILDEERDQLFARFFRGSAARQAEVPGTGLGLAIAWEIVQRHKGQIAVEGKGQGTTFFVWLPISTER